MLQFKFSASNLQDFHAKGPLSAYASYPEMLELEGTFQIDIDGRILFFEPVFPVLEFLFAVEAWRNGEVPDVPKLRWADKKRRHATGNMEYHSVETEDNPLIRFAREGELWRVESKWERFHSSEQFGKPELFAACENLRQQVMRQYGLSG